MLALGFSINLVTLFGLVLAIGMVVDDAIVVVENVERNMHEHHLAPKEATIKSMEEIAGSLVAVVLVMASVFIPAAFLPGTTGQLYKQFAITIVISVAVSGFVALTLTPAMCALMLKHNPPPQRGFFAWFNRQVDAVTRGFGHAVELVIKRAVIALVLLVAFLWSIYHLFTVLPTSFVPNEDQGYVMAAIIMPEAASMDRTQAVAEKVDAIFAKIPGVATRSMITGYSLLDSGFKTNAGAFFVTLKDFKERYDTTEAREDAERAGRADESLRPGPDHRAGDRHSGCPAADSRHRHHRRLRILDPGHRRRRPGAARPGHAGLPQEGTDVARSS